MDHGHVYFIQDTRTSIVKVGHTFDVKRRLAENEQDDGASYRLLGTIEGPRSLETFVHEELSAHRFTEARSGDRFWPTQEVLGLATERDAAEALVARWSAPPAGAGRDRFKQCRRQRGLSIRAMAKVFGVSHVTILDWESGQRPPTPPFREAIERWSVNERGQPDVPRDSWPISERERKSIERARAVKPFVPTTGTDG